MTWCVSRHFEGSQGLVFILCLAQGLLCGQHPFVAAVFFARSRSKCLSGACFGPGCVLDWLLTVRWKVEPDLPLVFRLSGQGRAGCPNLCTVGIGDFLLRALLTCYSAPSLTSTPQMPVATSGGRSKQLSQVVTKIFPDIVRCPWGAKSTPAENLRDGPLNKTGIMLRGHNHCVRLE